MSWHYRFSSLGLEQFADLWDRRHVIPQYSIPIESVLPTAALLAPESEREVLVLTPAPVKALAVFLQLPVLATVLEWG
ncbi:MAG: hypothetical protein AAB358_03995 [Patescibacteria group bacterium]